MVVFTLQGEIEVNTQTGSFIQAGENADIRSLVLTSEFSSQMAVEVSVSVFPQNFITEITSCDNNPSCAYTAYNFEKQALIPSLPVLKYVLDGKNFIMPNIAILSKITTPEPIHLSSPPTYDMHLIPYSGTSISGITNVYTPETCAAACDNLGSCQAFNFSTISSSCDLFSSTAVRSFTSDNYGRVSYSKASIPTWPQRKSYSWVPFNSDTAGNKCHDIDACNNMVADIITNHKFSKFTTGSLDACLYCPPRKFFKLPYGEEAVISNEFDDAAKVTSISDAVSNLRYKQVIESVSQSGCEPGTHRLMNGSSCVACTEVLPPNSQWRYLCQYTSCGVNEKLTLSGSTVTPSGLISRSYYCEALPYGQYTYTTSSGTIAFIKCGLQTFSPRTLPLVGYRFAAGACTFEPCDGINGTFTTEYGGWYTRPLISTEIYIADTLDVVDTVDYKGCRATACGSGSVANSTKTACVACPALGAREFRANPSVCTTCTIPYGYGSGYMLYPNGPNGYPDNTLPGTCTFRLCSTQPTEQQIWDTSSADLCAMVSCPPDKIASTDHLTCVNRPGSKNVCELLGDCVCAAGTTRVGNDCVPCTNSYRSFTYLTSNSCTLSACTGIGAGNVWSQECLQRPCYMGSEPNAGRSSCTPCNQPINNANGTRSGFTAAGSCTSLLNKPAPTGLVRWKYAIGLDTKTCPRSPGTNERWASFFGCDIVSYTGATSCATYPAVGYRWTDTTTCGTTQCPATTLSGSPYNVWGPGCTASPEQMYYGNVPNTDRTYPFWCTNWPDPGWSFINESTCTVRQCNFSLASNYKWVMDGTCDTEKCPAFTYSNAKGTHCLPCPTTSDLAGWKPEGNACLVLGCSTTVTLLSNQFFNGPNCAYVTCSPGTNFVNGSCVSCSSIASSNIWSSPGASCANTKCLGQTTPNATKTSCIACTPVTPAYGYTFTNVDGCTPAACPDIGTGSKYNSDCTTTFCTEVPNSTWDTTDVRGQCKFICDNISPGFKYTSSSGCAFTTCTAVPNTTWDPTDVRGQCKTIATAVIPALYSFTSFTFTPAGATGSSGPTSLTAYGTNYPGYGTSNVLSLSNGIQYWTVPETKTYRFTLAGAGSFNNSSLNPIKVGYGFVMTASYSLTKGQRIAILVGQRGLNDADAGGGTFVASVTGVGQLSTATPLFVAGGAGGPGSSVEEYENLYINGTSSGGVGPNGGNLSDSGDKFTDSGAGFSGNGALNTDLGGEPSYVPKSFKNGGTGGRNNGQGGFGGGAAGGMAWWEPTYTGGGGGGYGGGGGGGYDASGGGGGGGGSYDVTGVYSGSATNSDQGYVTVTKM